MRKTATGKLPIRASMAALALLAATAIPQAAQAQDDHAEVLAQIDAALPGTLINDPTTLDWRTSGGRVRTSDVIDPSIPGGGAATIYDVRRAGENPWDIQVYIPLTADISDGDTITFGFWARTLESEGDGGMGQISARIQQDASPWPGFGDTPLSIGADWRWYEVSAASNIRIQQEEAFAVLQLAAVKQKLEIGQAIAVAGADRIMGNSVRPAAQLPEPLAGRGQLINSPHAGDFGTLGPDGSHELRNDSSIWLGRAMQVTSPSAGDQPWSIQASVPIDQPIAAGERLEIAIAAKTVSAATDDGRARVGIRIQQTAEPYDGFGDNTFTLGESWQLVRLQTTASMDMPAGNAQVALHFAGAEQVVDLGPVYVIKLAEGQ